jgi:hypothetical protein
MLNEFEEPVWWFPFDEMKIGESFFIPTLQPANLIYIVDTQAKQAGVKVRAYTVSKDGFLGVRVWRMK